ncbi:expressed unknown protein [Seminavis robusta]|uniref:Uncharacterized protein n=1 Tax=Seminavis robusta TaxID=568900 RepID=A0A9N8D7F9_9STRA|nr:expressed unknown protein [Seminavis robusta]|eukprot:Sro6_g005520.1 n/a (452) ;mRNA; f:220524-221879
MDPKEVDEMETEKAVQTEEEPVKVGDIQTAPTAEGPEKAGKTAGSTLATAACEPMNIDGDTNDEITDQLEALLACKASKLVLLAAAKKDPELLDVIERVATELISCVKTTKDAMAAAASSNPKDKDKKPAAMKSLPDAKEPEINQDHASVSETPDDGVLEQKETRPDENRASNGENPDEDGKDKDEKVPDAKKEPKEATAKGHDSQQPNHDAGPNHESEDKPVKRAAKEELESTPPKRRSVSTGEVDNDDDDDIDHSDIGTSTRSPDGQADKIADYDSEVHNIRAARRVAAEGVLATSKLWYSRFGVTRKEINHNEAWKAIGLSKKFGVGAGLAPQLAYLSVEAASDYVTLDKATGTLTVTFLLPPAERANVQPQVESLKQGTIPFFWTEDQLGSGERLWHYIGHYQCERIWEEHDVTFSASFRCKAFKVQVAAKLEEIAGVLAVSSHYDS